jgi:hypothetical protein
MTALFNIKLWPSLRNPAWRRAGMAQAAMGAALAVTVRPTAIRRKLDAAAMASLKERFLVADLGSLPTRNIREHYTYLDMSDVAEHGDDLPATRLYQWLAASWAAGRPIKGRGQLLDSNEKITAYCQRNLDLLRSLQENGYSYSGPDEICFGIAADGEILHMRRGTHRITAAQILNLPSITGRVTHIDQEFANRVVREARQNAGGGRGNVVEILGQAIQEVTRQTLA